MIKINFLHDKEHHNTGIFPAFIKPLIIITRYICELNNNEFKH
jgi:hypothetical protein